MMRPDIPPLRLLATALLALALVPGLALPVSADHDGSDHPHEGPCDDPCEPTLTVTGLRGNGTVPNPWGYDPLYAGWTLVELELPDPEVCACFIEGWDYKWRTVVDHVPQGSAGIDVFQVDDDQWLVHNLDGDVYEITFTVYVYCETGEIVPVSTTWYQFN